MEVMTGDMVLQNHRSRSKDDLFSQWSVIPQVGTKVILGGVVAEECGVRRTGSMRPD